MCVAFTEVHIGSTKVKGLFMIIHVKLRAIIIQIPVPNACTCIR